MRILLSLNKTKADILTFQVNSLVPLNVIHENMKKAGYVDWDITFKNAAIAIAGVSTLGVGFAIAAGIHWLKTGKASVFCEAPELKEAREAFRETAKALQMLKNTGEETSTSRKVVEMVHKTCNTRRLVSN